MKMTIEKEKHGGMHVLTIWGKIGDAESNKLSKLLQKLSTTEKKAAIVDVSEVSFIGSYALGLLVHYSKQMALEGKQLYICNRNNDPDATVQRLFNLTNVGRKALTIVSSYEEIPPLS
jgi:anti-anti-sigma factor